MRKAYRLLTAALVGILLPAGVAAVPAAAAADRTGSAESRRVDRVPTPKLAWASCYAYAECATVPLPLDYDQPQGATIDIAVLRVKAKDQQHKIGSLFVNPGGPGGSGTALALDAPFFLSDSLLQRFDIVGVDPRGIGASTNVRCFGSVEEQTAVMSRFALPFPYGKAEEKSHIAAAQAFGRACSTTGAPISGAMSTAEVARDMDVIRRAVGDRKLNYLGFSYGTALGQYYANMFPDRFRALVVDGVIDPRAWVGNTHEILDARMHSAEGAFRALREVLLRCDRAGEQLCAFAAGDPVRRFDEIAQSLKQKPLDVVIDGETITLTYPVFVDGVLGILYGPSAGDDLTGILAAIWTALQGGSTAALAGHIQEAAVADPYVNGFEAASSVICTDTREPADARSWPAATAARDRQAPYFGRDWGWLPSQCATDTWTVRDEDAYLGPFNRRTAAPVLVVGSFWDPATNYDSAVASSRLLPNSRLLSSNNWGHTGYGTGPCVTAAIDAYLLTGNPPARGTVCTDAPQPFTGATATTLAATGKHLPPVVSLRPYSILK
ncbi:alpha/beta hydrolase [Actinoplanes sp. NPDC026619]|uniref:alpha/beta hydrolase n=1 Tax=Actinoplanes sp. NPDC026619 TaxID=3155798 RepID=UPI0033E90754